ncbi:MAG: TerC family protein, partial [Mycobacterium leprae]
MFTWLLWGLFNVLVIGLLALDLGVFHRKSHEVTAKEASAWTAVWVSLALLFNLFIYFWRGTTPALEYLTGYLMEESLSVDNIFVFVMILSYFKVPKQYQHRVLFWGVIGALVLRATFIGVGAALISRFHWILYLFGAFLVFTGIKMGLKSDDEVEVDENGLVKWVRKFLPVTSRYHYDHFFVREDGRLAATPLLLVLLMIESSDIIFAFDSIPAIFSVTQDPFIVYTSNIFAIMGLRSLFFLLASVV